MLPEISVVLWLPGTSLLSAADVLALPAIYLSVAVEKPAER